jgi:two-component system, OmpR family, sensor histidine kinase BaeS
VEVSAGMESDVGDEAVGAVAHMARSARRDGARVWGGAVVLAAVGTAIAFKAEPGVNWGIWTTMAAAGLIWLERRRARSTTGGRERAAPADPVARWAVALAILVAWGAALTANDLFQFFIVAGCVVLLAVAMRVTGGVPGTAIGAGAMAGAPLRACAEATSEAGHRLVGAATGVRGARHAATVRGIGIAVPVAGMFALVLAGADPTLTVWRAAIWDAVTHLDFLPRSVFFVGLLTIVLGAYGVAARPAAAVRGGAVARTRRMGRTERRLVIGAVAGVFGGFLAEQLAYLFRDTRTLRVSGLTYAEYAHRGFTELTIAATLAVALVVALDRYTLSEAPAGRPSNRWRYWGTLLLVGEVLVVLVSAFHRLTLYESAYGFTMLRLYVQAYVIGVAVTLLLLAGEVMDVKGGFDARRAARRAGVVAIAFLAAFSFGNPEAWVVSQNMVRYRASGDVDGDYLASLSLNAAPAVVAVLPELSFECAARVRWAMGESYARDLRAEARWHWYEWNLRRSRGVAALRGANIQSSRMVPGKASAGCMATGVEQ